MLYLMNKLFIWYKLFTLNIIIPNQYLFDMKSLFISNIILMEYNIFHQNKINLWNNICITHE